MRHASPNNKTKNPIRLLIADSTAMRCEMLAEAVRRDRQIQVIGLVTTTSEALELAAKQEVDVAIVSLHLDELSTRGLELVREFRLLNSSLRSIVLMDSHKSEIVVEAFRAGAKGIFSKDSKLKMLCKCVRCVYGDQIWASSTDLQVTLEAMSSAPVIRALDANGLALLSKRELNVVEAVAEGLTNHEIGNRLGLSKHTVKNYLLRIFDKLGVSNRVELLCLTLARGAENGHKNREVSEQTTLESCLREAENGVPHAQMKLANCCQHGTIVPKNLITAYMWYVLAEAASLEIAGQAEAEKLELMKVLNPAEIAEAERLARNSCQTTPGLPCPTVEKAHPAMSDMLKRAKSA